MVVPDGMLRGLRPTFDDDLASRLKELTRQWAARSPLG
jgi:hypothetical protein